MRAIHEVLSDRTLGPAIKGPGNTQVLGALWCNLRLFVTGSFKSSDQVLHNINNVCNVELSLSSIMRGGGGGKKKKKKNLKTYFGGKKHTAVFSFKKRTKYGKNVLVGISAYW